MKSHRLLAVVLVAATCVPLAARADTRQASIGNYYFEDDTTKDRAKIIVNQGDQVTFTVREPGPTPHSVNVDELDIHSPDLPAPFQTYTTPPLERPGTYRLYCKSHQSRNHVAALVVQAAPAQATAAPATAKPAAVTAEPRASAAARTTAPAATAAPAVVPAAAPSPQRTLTPVGVGTAPPEARTRPVTLDPRSLQGILGRRLRTEVPWTRALRQLAAASVAVIALGAGSLVMDARRRRSPPVGTATAPEAMLPAPPVPEPASAPRRPAKPRGSTTRKRTAAAAARKRTATIKPTTTRKRTATIKPTTTRQRTAKPGA